MAESALRIVMVDDEAAMRRLLKITLQTEGYVVFEAASGREAIDQVAACHPDFVLLDLGLPDLDGVEVIRLLREHTQIPIIILSVREQESEKIRALDAGADDYLTKPFGTGELLARIRVVMRRATQAPAGPIFSTGGLEVDFTRRLVTVNGREIHLTPTEYELLRILVAEAGKVLTHRQLLHQVWGAGYESESHLLRVTMGNLRRKLEVDPARPRWIITEPGIGYRLRDRA
jgi:two-component system, OmpR family, KDP operon response regulator KdpE